MPRLTEVERQHRRDEIAEAAKRCFARDGYSATSMADIIAEAASSAGAVYCHFESKAELLRFVATGVLRSRVTSLRRRLREFDGELGPAVVTQMLLESAPDADDAGLLVQMWAQVSADPELAEVASDTVLALRKIVRKALKPWAEERFEADPRARAEEAADAVVAAVHGYIVRCVLTPSSDPEGLKRSIVAGLHSAA